MTSNKNSLVALLILISAAFGLSACGDDAAACHPAYEPCLPNLEGDALDCADIEDAAKPVMVKSIGTDPYYLDADRNGRGCEVDIGGIRDLLDDLINDSDN